MLSGANLNSSSLTLPLYRNSSKRSRMFLTNSSSTIKYNGYLNRALNRINGIAEVLISAATLNTSTTEGFRRHFIKFNTLRL